jgi:hypothetical protein
MLAPLPKPEGRGILLNAMNGLENVTVGITILNGNRLGT